MIDVQTIWDELHKIPRFRPQYPSEFVTRFLFNNFPRERRKDKIKVLDIGCGAGRHVKLFAEQGFDVSGIDFSREAITHANEMLMRFSLNAKMVYGDVRELPYKDCTFDAAVSFGVFDYLDSKGMKKAIGEMFRVLKPRAKAFVLVRTSNDYRFGRGEQIEENTFILDTPETNEQGMTMHFLSQKDVYEYYSVFSKVKLEKFELTFNNLQDLDSAWIIKVEK